MFIVGAAVVVLTLAALTPSLRASPDAGQFKATAYCSCRKCCGRWGPHGITASGTHAHVGTIAADWSVLARGTRVGLSCFPGRVFVVEDRGGAIKGKRIDIWYRSHRSALRFGVHTRIQIKILPDPHIH